MATDEEGLLGRYHSRKRVRKSLQSWSLIRILGYLFVLILGLILIASVFGSNSVDSDVEKPGINEVAKSAINTKEGEAVPVPGDAVKVAAVPGVVKDVNIPASANGTDVPAKEAEAKSEDKGPFIPVKDGAKESLKEPIKELRKDQEPVKPKEEIDKTDDPKKRGFEANNIQTPILTVKDSDYIPLLDKQPFRKDVLKAGDGQLAKVGDKVVVNYTGYLIDGTVFDSSLNKGREPFRFTLGGGQVIKGWDQGFVGIAIGERSRLTISPEYAYGPRGQGPIAPNSVLIFVVELLKIE